MIHFPRWMSIDFCQTLICEAKSVGWICNLFASFQLMPCFIVQLRWQWFWMIFLVVGKLKTAGLADWSWRCLSTGDFIAIYSFTYKRHQCLNDAQKIKWQNSRTDDNPGLVVVWNKKQDFDKMWDFYKACLIVWLHDISCDISPAWLVVMVTAAYCLILGASDDTPFCASISNV